MKNTVKIGVVFSVAAGLVMTASLLFAHHSEAMLDKDHIVTLKGIVTRHDFVNPHQIIRFKVTDDNGRVTPWTMQGSPPGGMRKYGWTKDTLKPGDEVIVRMHACKDGRACGSWIMISKADGTLFPPKGIDKRFLAEYLQNHGKELSKEEYEVYKRYVTTGPAAVTVTEPFGEAPKSAEGPGEGRTY